MRVNLEQIFGKKSSLKRKVMMIYLLVAVMPIMIITISASIIYYNRILQGADSLVEQNARQHEAVVKERLELYENTLYELVVNSDCISLAKDINQGDENSFLVNESRMEKILRSHVYTYTSIRSAAFLADNGKFVTYSKWYGSTNESIWPDESKRNAIHKGVKKEQRLAFLAAVNLSNTDSRNDYVVMMGFPVRDLRTKEQSGVLVMALDDDILLFEKNLQKAKRDAEESGVTTVILDENNRILAGVGQNYVNKDYRVYLDAEFGNIKRISENKHKIEGTDWTILNVIDTAVYRREIYRLVTIVFLLTIAVTCIFFFVVFFISRKYIGTIQKIAQGIKDYEGTTAKKIYVDMKQEDELYVIVRQFNKMTVRVESLVETLQQRNKEIKIASASQKHAEIKALEAQINPHFLFNTLDSINWRAIEHDEEEISDMLGALGSLLRYSVSNIDMEVVMEAEISWLKKYVFLQRDRFHDSFDCIYDISEEALAFPIYKMLLQPIVENAILHAFREVKAGGLIFVTAFVRKDGKLEIHIRDNGCGMEEKKFKEICAEIKEKHPLSSKSIGIGNVIHRLRIYYQQEAEIKVCSKINIGSEFIIIIPRKHEEEML